MTPSLAHTAMRKPAEVWVFPVHLRQGKQPADDTAEVLAVMDLLSKHCFGCVSALTPTAQHAILLDVTEQLLDRLEANRTGRAS